MKRLLFFFLFLVLAVKPVGAGQTPDNFNPSWWCRGAHNQTILGSLFRKSPEVPLERSRLATPDGDVLVLDWLKGKPQSPIVVLLHGLGSSSDSAVIHLLLREIQKEGWQAVAINARGTVEPNKLPKITHGGYTADLNAVIQEILKRGLSEKIYLVGFSIGGNQSLKWLGETGESIPQVRKAVAVSVPYNLEKTARNLDKGFNKNVYTHTLLKSLKPRALKLAERFPGLLDTEKIAAAETFEVYDREVTAKLGGFTNEKEYWAQSSSEFYLDKIRKPVLLIHAGNDPFLTEEGLPLETIRRSEYLQLLLTSEGGHVGFVTGKVPLRTGNWLEKKIMQFLIETPDTKTHDTR